MVLAPILGGGATAPQRAQQQGDDGDGSISAVRRARTTSAQYLSSVLSLIGHLAGTAFVFIAFAFFGWLVSYGLHFLHGIHPFPDEVFAVLVGFELGLVYFDAALCIVVFAAGAVRFWKDLTR